MVENSQSSGLPENHTPIQELLTNFIMSHQHPDPPPLHFVDACYLVMVDGVEYLESSLPLNLDGTFG